jgi:tetratricopeptide (TPR) repeat protein
MRSEPGFKTLGSGFRLVLGLAILLPGCGDASEAESDRGVAARQSRVAAPLATKTTKTSETGAVVAISALAEAVPSSVIRAPSLDEQFAYAKNCRNIATQYHGLARLVQLQRAVQAYLAVDEYWPGVGALQAEAAFRRGEVLLMLDREGAAWGAFQQAMDRGIGTDFRPRALLQMGHIQRRRGQYGNALVLYARLRAMPDLGLRQANDAREWLGKSWMDLGQFDQAVEVFELWAACAENPLETVRATDLQALALLRLGKVNTARELLGQLRLQYQDLASENTEEAGDLFRALRRLRAQEVLAESERFGQGDGDGLIIGMTQAQAQSPDRLRRGDLRGLPMQDHARGGFAVGNHFKIGEAHTLSPTGAQALHAGFFGCKPGCEVGAGVSPGLTFLPFLRGEHALAHTVAAALQTGHKTGDIDQVYAQTGRIIGKQLSHAGKDTRIRAFAGGVRHNSGTDDFSHPRRTQSRATRCGYPFRWAAADFGRRGYG